MKSKTFNETLLIR